MAAAREVRPHSIERSSRFSIPKLERRDSGNPNLHPDYYMKVPSGLVSSVDGQTEEPTLYQPTPAGLDLLTQYFSDRHGCKLKHLSQEGKCTNSIRDRFNHFAGEVEKEKEKDKYDLRDGKPIGVVLSFGQMHAVPVMFEQRAGQKYLLIFDSTSGSVMNQYRHAANAFGDFQVMVNEGTRQADKQSCITDAVEILRFALITPGILDAVLEKAELEAHQKPAPQNGRPIRVNPIKLNQNNFYRFPMPEALCFTAQRPVFLNETVRADFNKPIKVGASPTSLGRELTKHTQISRRRNSDEYFPMNAYLYDASRMHKNIIDDHLKRGNSTD